MKARAQAMAAEKAAKYGTWGYSSYSLYVWILWLIGWLIIELMDGWMDGLIDWLIYVIYVMWCDVMWYMWWDVMRCDVCDDMNDCHKLYRHSCVFVSVPVNLVNSPPPCSFSLPSYSYPPVHLYSCTSCFCIDTLLVCIISSTTSTTLHYFRSREGS